MSIVVGYRRYPLSQLRYVEYNSANGDITIHFIDDYEYTYKNSYYDDDDDDQELYQIYLEYYKTGNFPESK